MAIYCEDFVSNTICRLSRVERFFHFEVGNHKYQQVLATCIQSYQVAKCNCDMILTENKALLIALCI